MAAMRRVRSDSLSTDHDGRLVSAGAPYTGLAYLVDEDGVVREIQTVEDGMVTGLSRDWLELTIGERLDRSSLELEDAYGPLVRRGEPVDGVVYFFNRAGACILEEAYEGGQPTDEIALREWYPSGAPKARRRVDDGEAWFEDGRLQARMVDGNTVFNLVVRDDGSLGGIVLSDATLFDVTAVRGMAYADELLLTGEAIDSGLLRTLRNDTPLGTVPLLRLSDTAVGPEAVEILASLAGLKELWLSENRSLDPRHAEELRTRRPDCIVHYEAAEE